MCEVVCMLDCKIMYFYSTYHVPVVNIIFLYNVHSISVYVYM